VTGRRARVAGATVPGAVHLRAGRPNQDAVRWLPPDGDGDRVVMAVADGHGSSACPRSGLGAALAVEVATDVLWQLAVPPTSEAVAEAVATIVAQWTTQVTEHLSDHPLTPREWGRDGATDRPGGALIYGATLLFAVVTAEYLVLGQLGDGDVVVVAEDGRAERPLPDDDRLIAHMTTSLSDIDAVASVRCRVLPTGCTRLVALSSDGYANSFSSDDAFLQVGPDVLRMAEAEGIDMIRAALPGWLAETTRDGAGDDTSVTIALLDPPAVTSPDPPRETASPPGSPAGPR